MQGYNCIPLDNVSQFPDPPLRVGVIPSHSDYQDSAPVYENLPQPSSSVISPVKPWTAILSDSNNPSSTERRRSNLQLMAPKPYTPYNRQSQPQSQTVQSYSGIPAENPPEGFSRTPPPPPVRGQKLIQPETTGQSYTAAPFSMTSALNGHVSPQGQRSPHSPGQNRRSPHSPGLGRRSSPRQQDLLKVPAWEKPIPKNRGRIIGPRRSANKGRYLTISSSQPIKLEKEKSSPQSPKHRSQAGDLISSVSDTFAATAMILPWPAYVGIFLTHLKSPAHFVCVHTNLHHQNK